MEPNKYAEIKARPQQQQEGVQQQMQQQQYTRTGQPLFQTTPSGEVIPCMDSARFAASGRAQASPHRTVTLN